MAGKCVTLTSVESIRLPESSRNEDVSRTIAMLYLDSAPMLLKVMAEAIDQGNLRQLSGAADSLASSSANLGAARLAGLCYQIAGLPSKAALQTARELMPEIESAVAAVCAKLTELIRTSATQQPV